MVNEVHISLHVPRRPTWVALGWVAVLSLAQLADAQMLYWDRNGATAGAGGGTAPSGAWTNTSRNWSTSAAGTVSTVKWSANRDAVFSAGTNATGSYTITISGTQRVSSVTVQEGSVTFTGGTLRFKDATPDLTVNSGTTLNWGSTTITSDTDELNIGGAGTLNFTSDLTFAGTVNLSGVTLRLTDVDVEFDGLTVTGDTIIDFAGTASTLTVGEFNILSGATLWMTNWATGSDALVALSWPGAVYDTGGLPPMDQVVINDGSALSGWVSFDNQIGVVPEPSTYGAALVGLLFAVAGLRRWRTPTTRANAPAPTAGRGNRN